MESIPPYYDLLWLLNLSPQEHATCIGFAGSKHRQCHNPVAARNRDEADWILSNIAFTNPDIETAKQMLEEVASLLLSCRRNHQDQSVKLSSDWILMLRQSNITTQSTSTVLMAIAPTISSNSRYHDLLRLFNLSPQHHTTCIGLKKTKDQCGCRVASESRKLADQFLSRIAATFPTIETAEQEMEAEQGMKVVAGLLLCKRFHQNQAAELSSEWTKLLREFDLPTIRHARRKNHSGESRTGRSGQYLRSAHVVHESRGRSESTATFTQGFQIENAIHQSRERSESATTSTQAMERSSSMTSTGHRHLRISDSPSSMTLHSTMEVSRDSHQECPFCKDGYGLENDTVVLCIGCHNIYHKECADLLIRQLRGQGHITCLSW